MMIGDTHRTDISAGVHMGVQSLHKTDRGFQYVLSMMRKCIKVKVREATKMTKNKNREFGIMVTNLGVFKFHV